ncbi:MAG: carbon-nitrogen family hydrolase [Deltaproteobacteria bacterium]|nr:carbon-nitrogen family hydrolase [Deltaproteobacteria bacterium]
MRVASIQMAVVEGDKTATIAQALKKIDRCGGVDLIILPEIWNVGFMSFDRYHAEAEDFHGQTLTALTAAAKAVGAYLHTGSLVERVEDKYYNSSYLLSPQGRIVANYRKIHLFGYKSKETQLLSPGEEAVVVETPLAKIGLATCYDLRFPELFRRMVDQGAELFLVCSAWPYPRLEAWIMLNRVRALENQCYLVSANSCGLNMGAVFAGHSMVSDPWGVILAGAGDEETIVEANLDIAQVQEIRHRFPPLADRRDWLQSRS